MTLHYFDTETTIGGFQYVDMKPQIDPFSPLLRELLFLDSKALFAADGLVVLPQYFSTLCPWESMFMGIVTCSFHNLRNYIVGTRWQMF